MTNFYLINMRYMIVDCEELKKSKFVVISTNVSYL